MTRSTLHAVKKAEIMARSDRRESAATTAECHAPRNRSCTFLGRSVKRCQHGVEQVLLFSMYFAVVPVMYEVLGSST